MGERTSREVAAYVPGFAPEQAAGLGSGVTPGSFDPAAGGYPAPSPSALPLDWWRCVRATPVSGRYGGKMGAPNAGKFALDLRVDVDQRDANSPVMNRVSGDVYEISTLQWLGRTVQWRVYRESWIVDNPSVTWTRCGVGIKGSVRYWKGAHTTTQVEIQIPWNWGQVGPAEVKFTDGLGGSSTYNCAKQSTAFRDVMLEVDVCKSINSEPILPSYDTHSHASRPPDLAQRLLNIEQVYREAGIEITIDAARSIIDDSAAGFSSWSAAELHDAMEQYFSGIVGTWPKWSVWCLLASTFDLPSVGGVMFDAADQYGGAGKSPERQGCAVFRNHPWFNDLVANPGNGAQAAAMRQLLYTYVHEIGHVFNFLHSWDKNRPDALSWMNYDWKYDERNGEGSFWTNFRMRFDDEELLHLRHGDRAAVIMGGDPWASGAHLETPAGAMVDLVGQAPVELLLRSKGYFQFMEPVSVEFRLRNGSDLPLELDLQLHPEYGNTIVYIRRPNGQILEYSPILCRLATPEPKPLKPQGAAPGEDRYSQNVALSYGRYGYYFDEPGEYVLRAVYQGAGGLVIPSNLHRIRIGRPFSVEEERLAQDFFGYEAGMALYLNGSSSPFLSNGMATIEDMAERFEKQSVGAQLALVLAENLTQPFYRVKGTKLVKARAAKPDQALALTTRALEQHKRDPSTFTNLGYHALRRTRADVMVTLGVKDQAEKELQTLVKDLKKQGVHEPVLAEISAYAETLVGA